MYNSILNSQKSFTISGSYLPEKKLNELKEVENNIVEIETKYLDVIT